MGSVWKRLQRVNKRAAKFNLVVSFEELLVEATPKWQPKKIGVTLWRRNRRVMVEPRMWEPTMKNPMKGIIVWPIPESKEIAVTIFKDPRTSEYEDKDWNISIEDVSTGKPRPLATSHLNVKEFAFDVPTQTSSEINLKPLSKKIVSATVKFTVSSCLIREGKATDEDMQSLASLISTSNVSDIAPLEDLDGEEEDKSFLSLDKRKFSEVSNLTSAIDSLTVGLSEQERQAASPGKSEGSMTNSILEDLPQESPYSSGDYFPGVGLTLSPDSTHGSPNKKSTTPKGLSPLLFMAEIDDSVDSEDRYAPNLSKITERTELPDSRTQSVKDNSINADISYLSDPKHIDDINGKSYGAIFTPSKKENEPTRQRSVFHMLIACLFPWCRF